MYNGYADQQAFVAALADGFADYIAQRNKKLKENPEGLRHEGCDHAYGICSAGGL
jgi:hypothetical protein